MIFTFTYGDQKYEWDDDKMSLGEARYVKQVTGMVGSDFYEAARKLDPDAIMAILVLARRRAGETSASLEDFDMEDSQGYINLIMGMDATGSPKKE